MTKGPLHLVDGSGYIFRAFHGLPPLSRADGTPVNAVLGFCSMLLRLLVEVKAEAVAVVFDAHRRTFRNDIYPLYKANRPEAPPELVPQFALVREATRAFGLESIELDGYEADDILATYARLAREAGRPVTIHSSDKDLMQLVGEGVGLWDPMKNRALGPAEVMEKFGVPPEKVVDVQALAGDSSDNVPGVPGIGIKTAAQLIQDYGDLETLLARAGEIRQPKRRESLLEHADMARISRRLVQLATDAPVPVPLAQLQVNPPDAAVLRAFLQAQGFRNLLSRLDTMGMTAGAGKAPAPASVPVFIAPTASAPVPASVAVPAAPAPTMMPPGPDSVAYELVQTPEALALWVAEGFAAGLVAVDTETDSLTPATAKLVGISLATAPGRACYIPLGHVDPASGDGGLDLAPPPRQLSPSQALALLKPLLEAPDVLKVGHNLKFDWQLFAREGVILAPHDDTMLMSYVLDGASHGHGMDELSERHLGHKTITFDEVTGTGKARITFDRVPLDRACTYAAEDADITLRLHQVLKPRLVAEHRVTLYETIERPMVPVVAAMEQAGIRVDAGILAGLSQTFGARLANLEGEIHGLAGRRFNVASPKQLGEILFDEMKLTGSRRGKTGAWSTDSAILEPLAEEHPIAARVLDWRQLAKLRSTYTDALPRQISLRTGRVHTSFALAATNTGRLSSTDPNLQNIPIRTEEGRRIRTAFVAESGHVLVSVDYSQIELRLVAEIAGIAALKEAFREGQDIHALTASQVFNLPLAAVTPDIRRQAKAINFGIIYGMSGFGLGQQLGIAPGEANAFIRNYLDRFHELRDWMETTKVAARQQGWVETLFGRRCHVPGITDRNAARRAFAERQAINAPIQGSAADIMKRAMIRVPAALTAAGLSARLLLQVHDELVLEAPEAEATATAATVAQVMETTTRLSVPLVAEARWAKSWAEAH